MRDNGQNFATCVGAQNARGSLIGRSGTHMFWACRAAFALATPESANNTDCAGLLVSLLALGIPE